MFALYLNILVWLSAGMLYTPIFVQLYSMRWQIVDYTHAYFILPISLWLTWKRLPAIWEIINKSKPKARLQANAYFVLFFFGLSAFILGWRQDYLVLSSASLIPLSIGLTGFLYGSAALKEVLFPIFYLALLVPPPMGVLDQLTLPMRQWVSYGTEVALKMLHYPVSREGLLIFIGSQQIYVGEPCSGMRSLVTILALALLYAYLNKGSFKKKTILVLAAVPLALVGNLVRIISMCLVTFYLGESVGQKYFHDYSGLVLFVLLILALMGLDSLIKEKNVNA